jgi:hypothetical protein
MNPQVVLPWLLLMFGIGFLVANIKVVNDLLRFRARRRAALLIWKGAKPRFYRFCLALGVVLWVLLALNLFVLGRRPAQTFGVMMMFVYYGLAFPLSTTIARGFYEDGVWSDSGFMAWSQISAVSWREDGRVTLVLISRLKQIARKLEVPGNLYGEARRLLRDKVKAHDIHIGGAGLNLGSRDETDAI